MILTLLIDPPFVLFLGVLFACALSLTSRVRIRHSRALWGGLALLTIFNIAVAFSYWHYPDWMWMYLFASAQWSSWIQIGALVCIIAAYYLLFLLGFYWGIRSRVRFGRAWPIGLIFLALCGLVILVTFDQYYHVGSLAEYRAGTALPLATSSLTPIFNTMFLCIATLGPLLIWWARREP